MTSPQLIITLTPDRTGLQAELPGLNGSRRVVALRPESRVSNPYNPGSKEAKAWDKGRAAMPKGTFEASCLRMLLAVADTRPPAIGEDGAPTQAQVRHWEQHSAEAPKDGCGFCLELGWVHSRARRGKIREHTVGDGSVKVRRVPAKGRRPVASRLVASLEELGL